MTRDFVFRTRHDCPHVGTIGQFRDSCLTLAGTPCGRGAGYRRKTTKYLRIPPRDRSNGDVALPALVGVRTRGSQTSRHAAVGSRAGYGAEESPIFNGQISFRRRGVLD